jgi:nucleotide-binding universal stress UspA family protein
LRITAGVDLSLASEAVAGTLRMLAQATDCRLDLVHLFWPPREHERMGLTWTREQTRPDPWVEAGLGRELRARLGRILDRPGHEAAVRLRPQWGDDPAPLVSEAREQQADLLVVGVSRHGVGTTAFATLRAAALPVLCVPAGDPVAHDLRGSLPPVRGVMVPVDFSPLSVEAIPHAYRLVPRGGTVVLAHIVEAGAKGLDADVRDELEKDLSGYVPAQAGRAGVATHTVVYEAKDAAVGILHLARRLGVDLLVMSSHGRTGIGRVLVGSVAEAVVRDADVPVVVVPSRRRLEG